MATPSPAAIQDVRASIAWRFSPRYSVCGHPASHRKWGGGRPLVAGINLRLLRPEDSFRYELSMIRLGICELITFAPPRLASV
jgi:hypothetical protein